MQFNDFVANPFDDKRFSRERKILFGYDNAARLTALDPAAFAAEIAATTTACGALEKALGQTGSAVGTGRGNTIGTNDALQHYRDVVGSKFRVAQDRLGKTATVLTTVFGKSIQRFTTELTKTNAAARLEELDLLLAANKGTIGDDIVTAIADAAEAYTGKRTVQRTSLTDVSTAQLAAQTAEVALDQQLWGNACRVVLVYPSDADADKARRHAAANYSLLVRPAHAGPQKISGSIEAHALLNLFAPDGADVLTPTTALVLHNIGPDGLRFGLGKDATDLDEATARTLAAGEKLTLTAANLGDVGLRPYLNCQNPMAAPGAYEVIIG